MKRLRILGLSLLALFALSTALANVALGEEGLLPTSNFTIKGATQKLLNLNGEKITCKTVTGTGTPTTGEKDKDTLSTGTLEFTGCESLGFPTGSLGTPAKEGKIKQNVIYLLCLTSSVKLDWAVLVEAANKETVHLEIPALSQLILVKGAIIGDLLTKLGGALLEGEPTGTVFGVSFTREDEPKRRTCSLKGLGEWANTYEAALDTKADVDAWQEGESEITFAAAVKFMDT
jgi:hypothetical protein